MKIHKIEKENFVIPESFACIEHGTFQLKEAVTLKDLKSKSETLERDYLEHFSNSKAHYVGSLGDIVFSEIAFGETLGKTKQICYGYLENKVGLEFLGLLDEKTMELDFYSVLA